MNRKPVPPIFLWLLAVAVLSAAILVLPGCVAGTVKPRIGIEQELTPTGSFAGVGFGSVSTNVPGANGDGTPQKIQAEVRPSSDLREAVSDVKQTVMVVLVVLAALTLVAGVFKITVAILNRKG